MATALPWIGTRHAPTTTPQTAAPQALVVRGVAGAALPRVEELQELLQRAVRPRACVRAVYNRVAQQHDCGFAVSFSRLAWLQSLACELIHAPPWLLYMLRAQDLSGGHSLDKPQFVAAMLPQSRLEDDSNMHAAFEVCSSLRTAKPLCVHAGYALRGRRGSLPALTPPPPPACIRA